MTFRCEICKKFISLNDPGVIPSWKRRNILARFIQRKPDYYVHRKCLKIRGKSSGVVIMDEVFGEKVR